MHPLPPLDPTLHRMDYGRALKDQLLMETRPDNWLPYARPLADAVDLFNQIGVGYALIGGIAAMYYGRSRFTENVDFVAAAGHMDLLSANPIAMENHHFDPGCTFKLYHRSGVQIGIWKDEFADGIITRSVPIDLAGRTVRMIEPHDLIAMKLRGGRLKDDYDVSEVAKANPIDRGRLASLVPGELLSRYDQIIQRA